ncbi:MAG TPA: peptide ABC transporter substrate-binding protein [Thermomicrobiales bacterium]|nr:peptide ABC transporter substrate-binding protein [Thermomicrobiales bacterium]
MSQSGKSQVRDLAESYKCGTIDRRQFMARATAIGVPTAVAFFMANAAPIVAAGGSRNGFAFYAQDATPAAGTTGFPAVGMEGRTRGEGGELRIIQWQAATHLNSHRSTGTKDFMAADIINEPLMRYAEDGSLLPNLVTEVPSVENGMLSEDLAQVTFSLLPDVVWSDGEPFTSRDVQFTWEWITTESNSAVTFATWDVIESIETPDELTAVVTFKQPSAAWFDPFTGGNNGHIYPAHAFGDDPSNANEGFLTAPIGTGPYVVESFTANDQVTYAINENYRFPDKPFFSTIFLKGGGDAASAARAVLETAEYDYAWNLQVEPDVLAEMAQGGQGQLVVIPGTSVERININFSDPDTEVDGQRSEMNTPHPFLTDPAVREALNTAIDRALISDEFYGEGEPPTANVFTGLASFESPNTSWEFDLEQAAQILEDAGWVMDGAVRAKDGVALELTYATTINQVRQKTQVVVKEFFEQLGFGVTLEQVDAGIFFDNAAGNDQNIGHMYVDINMYTNGATTPVPIAYTGNWYSGGEDRGNIAQASNNWLGTNRQRWISDEYDALYEQLLVATDVEAAFDLIIQMNDVIINDRAIIPIVNRASDTYAASNTLELENIAIGVGFELNYWNLANWNRTA